MRGSSQSCRRREAIASWGRGDAVAETREMGWAAARRGGVGRRARWQRGGICMVAGDKEARASTGRRERRGQRGGAGGDRRATVTSSRPTPP